MSKIYFLDRNLRTLFYNVEKGPQEQKKERMGYRLDVSEPSPEGEDRAVVQVQAKLFAEKIIRKGEKGEKAGKGEAPEREPFLSLDFQMIFQMEKPTTGELDVLKEHRNEFETYARNLSAEMISLLLMNTPYRMPNFPR